MKIFLLYGKLIKYPLKPRTEERMQKLKLKNVTSDGDWIINGKDITSRGGVYVGSAKTVSDAKAMALGPKLLEWIEANHKDDVNVKQQIEELLNSIY